MLDLMFAAALSGTRAAEAARVSQPHPIDYGLASLSERKLEERDWRTLVDGLSFEEGRECAIFFQKEVQGFGVLRVTPRCTMGKGK